MVQQSRQLVLRYMFLTTDKFSGVIAPKKKCTYIFENIYAISVLQIWSDISTGASGFKNVLAVLAFLLS